MRVLTVIPTYNEKENLPIVVERLRKAAPEVDILVVDDNSPMVPVRLLMSYQLRIPRFTFCTAPLRTVWVAHTFAGFDWGLEGRLRRSD